ncbi:MAG: hypothetical protein KGL39_12465 [Patescibacteria group bacterium]|nr:hypothetical protein [Patescibacteria group bacterium]
MSDNLQGVLNGKPEQPQGQQGQSSNQFEDMLTGWVRGSYMVSALAPEDVRGALTTAQNSFGAMVDGAFSGQRGPALEARKQWEQSATQGLQANRQRLIDYGLIWGNEEMPLDQKMAAIREAAMRRGDTSVAAIAASPEQFATFGKFYDQMSQYQQQAEQATQVLDQLIKKVEAKLPPDMSKPDPIEQQKFGDVGDLPPIGPYLR